MVLPEDDANRQVANGFHLQVHPLKMRRLRVLPVVGGWRKVLEHFLSNYATQMENIPARFMVLLIDFDGDPNRLGAVQGHVPANLRNRVFVLGALNEPEALKAAGLGSFEEIGKQMAEDCRDETYLVWGHNLLRHNAEELRRLSQNVRQILFSLPDFD